MKMICCEILTVLEVKLQDASFCEISDRCSGEPLILTMIVEMHEWLSKQLPLHKTRLHDLQPRFGKISSSKPFSFS
jgi:hypothetical protein